MRRIIRRIGNSGTSLGAILSAFALVCAIGAATAGPAHAEDRDRDHNERGRSDARAPVRHVAPSHNRREVRGDRRSYGYDTPSYGGYAPPIVYAPPSPSAGINLIIPLRF